jgi:8-hydroxy-5-deazaflavin:NADPH oxidoreductase
MSNENTLPAVADSTIGILGSGQIGSAFARALARVGISAVIANSRGAESLTELVAEIGATIRAGAREEAASQDIVLIAVPWSKLPGALAGLPEFGNRIVIDANNPIEPPLFRAADLCGRPSSEIVAEYVPGARLVKAFNHLPSALVASDPSAEGGRRIAFFSGDDEDAKAQIGALIERLGFFGIDLGALAGGGLLARVPSGPLAVHNLIKFS